MLIGAFFDNPYGYYILLRWVCFGVFGWTALVHLAAERNGQVWTCILIALLYNPILHVHLGRDIWLYANAATILTALFLALPHRAPKPCEAAHHPPTPP